MTDTPKPPMVVWLQHGSDDDVPLNELDASEVTWSDQCCFGNDYGPYVHLEQFMAEAKKRSKRQKLFLPDIIEEMIQELKQQQ